MKLFQTTIIYLLAATYLLISTGFGLKVHYCHDDITSVAYYSSTPTCQCEDEMGDMDCCSTEEGFFQFQEESLPAIQEILTIKVYQAFIELEQIVPIADQNRPHSVQKTVAEIDAVPIYLRTSAFLFYG